MAQAGLGYPTYDQQAPQTGLQAGLNEPLTMADQQIAVQRMRMQGMGMPEINQALGIETTPPEPVEGGVDPQVSTLGNIAIGGRSLAEDTLEGVGKWLGEDGSGFFHEMGEAVGPEAAQEEATARDYADIESDVAAGERSALGGFASKARDAIEQSLPSLGVAAAGALTGGKVGATVGGAVGGPPGAAIGGTIGAFTGAAASMLPGYFNQNTEKAVANGLDPKDPDIQKRIWTASAGQTIMDSIVPGKIARMLGVGNIAERAIMKGLTRAGAKAATKEGLTEAATEAGQEITSELFLNPELWSQLNGEQKLELKPWLDMITSEEVALAAVAGGALGGAAGGGAGTYHQGLVNKARQADVDRLTMLANAAGVSPDRLNEAAKDPKLAPKLGEASQAVLQAERMRNAMTKYHDTTPGETGLAEMHAANTRADSALDALMPMLGGKTTAQLRADKAAAAKARDAEVRTKAKDAGFVPQADISTEEIDRNVSALQAARAAREDAQRRLAVAQKPTKRIKAQSNLNEAIEAEATARENVHRHVEGKSPQEARQSVADWRRGAAEAERRGPAVAAQRARNFSPDDDPITAANKALDILDRFDPKKTEGSKGLLDKIVAARRQVDTAGSVEEMQAAEQKVRDLEGRLGQPAPIFSAAEEVLAELPEEVVASVREQRAGTTEAKAKPTEEPTPERQEAKAKPEPAPVEAAVEPASPAAQPLPEAPERYFTRDAQTQDVPLDKLTPKRARPGGIEQAGELMAKASRGEVPPRAPISVRAEPDGSYTILDGNSTYANAKASGWKSMPVRVLTDEQFHEENAPKLVKGIQKDTGVTIRTTAKDGRIRAYVSGPQLKRGAVVKAINARAAKAGLNVDIAPSSERAPTKAPEREAAPDEAYLAPADPVEFQRRKQAMRRRASEVNPDLDVLMRASAVSDPTFQEANRQIAADLGVEYVVGPPKRRERIEEKLREDGLPLTRASYITDMVRGLFTPRTAGEADRIVEALRAQYGEEAIADKGWMRLPESGYTDRKLLLLTPEGVIAEIQLVAPAMYAAKEPGGHALYERSRTIAQELSELQAQQRALYDAAAAKDDGSFSRAPGYSASTPSGASDLNPNGSAQPSPSLTDQTSGSTGLQTGGLANSSQSQTGLSTSATPGASPATYSEPPSSMNLGNNVGSPSVIRSLEETPGESKGLGAPEGDPRHDGYFIDKQHPWVSLVNEVGSNDPAALEENMRAWTAENGFEASAIYTPDGTLLGAGTNRHKDGVATPKPGVPMPGNIFTHTHPAVTPFSSDDIGLMMNSQMVVRAILPDGQTLEVRPGERSMPKKELMQLARSFADGPVLAAIIDSGIDPKTLTRVDSARIRQEAFLRLLDAQGLIDYSVPLDGLSPEHLEIVNGAVEYGLEGDRGVGLRDDGRPAAQAAGEDGAGGSGRAGLPQEAPGAEADPDVAAAFDAAVVGDEDRISTRFPKQVKSTEDPLASGDLIVNEASMRANMKAFEHNMERIRSYPGWSHGDLDADATAAAFKQDVKDNLLWLHDQIDPDVSARTRLWYKGARRIVDVWASRYGLPPRSIAGVMAALSPQKDWYQNVSLAERTLDIMTGEQDTAWSPAMTAAANLVFKPGNADHRALKASITGKTLREMQTPIEKAAWVRIFDTANNPRTYREVTSDGDFAGPGPRNVAWGSFAEIAKAIKVIDDPSYESVSRAMGEKHKVRNFFNNIIAPDSAAGDVTIDTHAVAAALMRPLSGNTAEVMDNFGNSLAVAHQQPGYVPSRAAGISGTSGLYGLYADAYREAAAARGLLPREMQSITWEAARGLFDAAEKRIGTGKPQAADAIWKEVTDGKATPADARQRVSDLFGGLRDPSWLGRNPEVHGPEERSSYAETLPRSGIPGWGSEPIAGGAGGGAAGTVPFDWGRNGPPAAGDLWTDVFDGDPFNSTRGLVARGEDSVFVPEPGQPGYDAPTTGERAGQGSGRAWSQAASGGARPLRGLPANSPGPNPRIVEAATRYLTERGMPVRRQAAYAKVDVPRATRIAEAFEAMPDDINAPGVREAYDQLAKEVIDQYQAAIDSGLQVSVITPDMGDPYPEGPKQVLRDLQTGHMWVYPTTMGFGSLPKTKSLGERLSRADAQALVDYWNGRDGGYAEMHPTDRAAQDRFGPRYDVTFTPADTSASNPMLQPTDFMVGNHRMVVNDLFRVVHDFFGHGREGVGFGAAGEENTWQSHVRMFSPLAARAMTTETRGQNSWVNYGPYGESNRANQRETVFADQKLGLLPEWASTEGLTDDMPPAGPGTYVSRPVTSGGEALQAWAKEQGFEGVLGPRDMHVTTAYSVTPAALSASPAAITAKVVGRPVKYGNGLVVRLEAPEASADWQRHMDAGASWDHGPTYSPHVTFKYNPTPEDIERLATVEPFRGEMALGPEHSEPLERGKSFAAADVARGVDTDTPAFKAWFKGSVVTRPDGSPRQVFHGTDTKAQFTGFQPGTWFSADPAEASAYAFPADLRRREKASGKYDRGTAPELAGTMLPYYGTTADLDTPTVGQAYATDGGIVRARPAGRWTFLTDLEVDYGTFDGENIRVKRGDGEKAARKEMVRYEEAVRERYPGGDGGRAFPVYLSIKSPVRLGPFEANRLAERLGSNRREIEAEIAKYEAEGYDGIVTVSDEGTMLGGMPDGDAGPPADQFMIFRPEQAKSAIGNSGAFDPNDPDIARGTDLAWPEYMQAPGTPGSTALRTLQQAAADPRKALSSWALKLETEIVNQFAPIRALEVAQHGTLGVGMDSAFKSAEIAINDSGRAETLMYYGAGALDSNGAFRPAPGTIGIRSMLDKLGSGKAILQWQQFMAARRAEHLKARGFKVPLTDSDIAEGLAMRTPLFDEVAADWKRFNDANIDLLERTGTIKPAAAKALKADPTYIPFYRADERIDGQEDLFDEFGIGSPARQGNAAGSRVLSNRDPGIKRMRGGEVLKLDNLVENMIKNSHAQVAAAMRNSAMAKATDLMVDAGLAFVAKGSKKPHKSAMAALIDGRKRWVVPTDAAAEPLFIALAGMKPQQLTGLHKGMATIASFFRHGITSSPAFMVRNLIRGMVSTGILTSGANLGVANNVFTGAAASLRRAAPRQVFTAMSGMGDFRFGGHDTGLGDNDWMVEYGLTRPTFGSQWRRVLNSVEQVGTATELGDRLAAMQTMIKNGVRPDEAAYHALTIVNYSRQGSNAFLRNMLPLIPFLNARIQGLARLGGGAVTSKGVLGKRQAAMQLALNGTLLAMASAALWGWNHQDEEREEKYDAEPLHRRLNYHIVYAGDYKVLIPKAFEIGALFGSLPEMILQAAGGDTSELGEAARQTLVNTFSFNPIPAAALPAVEAAANYSFFTGQPIESQRFEGLLPRERVDKNTSAVARVLAQSWLGDWAGVSPVMAQHILDGYGGAPFGALAAATDLVAGDLGLMPARPAGALGTTPVLSKLAENTIGSMFKLSDADASNRYLGGFYDLKTAITQVYRSAKEAAQSGDTARYQAIIEQTPGAAEGVAAAYKMVNKAGGKLTELNRAIRTVESDKTLTPEAKRAQLVPLVNARNQLTEQVYRSIRALEERAGKRFASAE